MNIAMTKYKVLTYTTILSFTFLLGGCVASEVQESGQIVGRIGENQKESSDDDSGFWLSMLGSGIEIAGTLKETSDIVQGKDEKSTKGYQYGDNPSPEIVDDVIIKDKNRNYYEPITSPKTHRVWLDRNLGAMNVCDGVSDVGCMGDYFQWGRKADGHERWDSYTTKNVNFKNSDKGNLPFLLASGQSVKNEVGRSYKRGWSSVNDEANPCPRGYRLPIPYELQEEMQWDKDNKFLKLPYNGYRSNVDGKIKDEKKYATLWSGFFGYYVQYDQNGTTTVEDEDFLVGRAVRCIKD